MYDLTNVIVVDGVRVVTHSFGAGEPLVMFNRFRGTMDESHPSFCGEQGWLVRAAEENRGAAEVVQESRLLDPVAVNVQLTPNTDVRIIPEEQAAGPFAFWAKRDSQPRILDGPFHPGNTERTYL